MKYISSDQATQAKTDVKNLTFAKPKEYIVAPHFVQYVKEQLVAKYGEQMVTEGGLKVTTTLDLDKQALESNFFSSIVYFCCQGVAIS